MLSFTSSASVAPYDYSMEFPTTPSHLTNTRVTRSVTRREAAIREAAQAAEAAARLTSYQYCIMFMDAPAGFVTRDTPFSELELGIIVEGIPAFEKFQQARGDSQRRDPGLNRHTLHPAYQDMYWFIKASNVDDDEDINEQAYGKLGVLVRGTVIVATKNVCSQ